MASSTPGSVSKITLWGGAERMRQRVRIKGVIAKLCTLYWVVYEGRDLGAATVQSLGVSMKQFVAGFFSLLAMGVLAQSGPIKIGEINSYSSMPQFTTIGRAHV